MDRDAAIARAYLLGQLDEQKAEEVEARYFADEASFDEIDAAADRLCDDYVRGVLNADDAARIRALAAQADWRRRLRFAKALHQELAGRPRASVSPAREPNRALSMTAWLRDQALGMRFGLAAAALTVALGWPLLVVQMRQSRAELAALRADLQPQVDAATARAASAEAETSSLRSRATALERSVADQSTVSLVLLPGMSRADGDRLVVAKDAAFVRFKLALERDPAPGATYRAVLRTVDRAVVWSQDGVTLAEGPDRSPFVTVPAIVLREGQYELLLLTASAAKPFEEVAAFSFQISRR